jgi:tellurite resistance protein TehA-like permease
MLYVFGFVVALIMWGFGLLWLFFAVSTIYNCRRFPFNMGWWSFTFPLGLSALCLIIFSGKKVADDQDSRLHPLNHPIR